MKSCYEIPVIQKDAYESMKKELNKILDSNNYVNYYIKEENEKYFLAKVDCINCVAYDNVCTGFAILQKEDGCGIPIAIETAYNLFKECIDSIE